MRNIPKKKVIAARNLEDWTKFTSQNNDKTNIFFEQNKFFFKRDIFVLPCGMATRINSQLLVYRLYRSV